MGCIYRPRNMSYSESRNFYDTSQYVAIEFCQRGFLENAQSASALTITKLRAW